MAPSIKSHFQSRWNVSGWASDPVVHTDHNLTINAMKQRTGLTVQTGNITRAFYDLLKFQAMFLHNRIDMAVLMVPTAAAASILGSNLASFNRITDEMGLFFHIITVPVLVV